MHLYILDSLQSLKYIKYANLLYSTSFLLSAICLIASLVLILAIANVWNNSYKFHTKAVRKSICAILVACATVTVPMSFISLYNCHQNIRTYTTSQSLHFKRKMVQIKQAHPNFRHQQKLNQQYKYDTQQAEQDNYGKQYMRRLHWYNGI